MADQTLACPSCGQQTLFTDVDQAPRGVICGDCGPGNVLGTPSKFDDADAVPATKSPAPSTPTRSGETAADWPNRPELAPVGEASARDAALGEFTEA